MRVAAGRMERQAIRDGRLPALNLAATADPSPQRAHGQNALPCASNMRRREALFWEPLYGVLLGLIGRLIGSFKT